MRRHGPWLPLLAAAAFALVACGGKAVAASSDSPAAPSSPLHVVIVVEENHPYTSLERNPYFAQLAAQGALMTHSSALTHPSQPNYLALFSGSTQGVTDDACPPPGAPFSGANLASQLADAGFTFAGYSEDLPAAGYTRCSSKGYDANHNPWAFFSNVPAASNQPFSAFPSDYSQLPAVSFVVPNIQHDAHNGTVAQAATWLQTNLDAYRAWALANNSILIVTCDEDDGSQGNRIYTVFVGQHVQAGNYSEAITHLNLLSTVEDLFGLPHLADVPGVSDVFK